MDRNAKLDLYARMKIGIAGGRIVLLSHGVSKTFADRFLR